MRDMTVPTRPITRRSDTGHVRPESLAVLMYIRVVVFATVFTKQAPMTPSRTLGILSPSIRAPNWVMPSRITLLKKEQSMLTTIDAQNCTCSQAIGYR